MNELPLARKSVFMDTPAQYYSTVGVHPVRIGNVPMSHIMTTDTDATLAIEHETLKIMDAGDVYLNGKKVDAGEYGIKFGDSVWVGTTNIVIHEHYIACTGENFTARLNISTHTPKKYDEYPIYKRSPRVIKREPTEEVDINAPKDKQETKKGELARVILPPLTMALVTVGMGIMLGRGIFVLVSAAMMMVTVVFSFTRYLSDAKERKIKEKERVQYYDQYLLTRRKKIHDLYEAQRESLLYHNLSPQDIEKEVRAYSSRLYERSNNDSDFMTLSVGYSTVPTSYKLKSPADAGESTKDELIKEMRAVCEMHPHVDNMPTVVDLKQAHLGLVGEKTYIHRQIFSILTQLCFFQSYLDVEIILLIDDEDWSKFEWVRWLPHCKIKSINITGLIAAENQRDQVLGNVAQVLKMRKLKKEEEKKDSRFLPHYLFIIDNPSLIINHSIMEYLQTPSTDLGFSMIYTTNIQANLPENIKTVLILDGGDNATLLMNDGNLLNRHVILPPIQHIDFETIARKLAPIQHSQGVSTQIPENITFFELYNVKHPEEIPVLALWERNATHRSLSVPLGLRGKDDMVYLNLHEKAHGPHGLVAGTTGSGKSEIVQSYILSLAINFHPHDVGFLLIDYKGGGMANLFSNLPHLLGTITNLDGSESMRALVSIKSELARRQRIFGEHNVNHINNYSKLFKAGEALMPMPHLFIISDEFAELKKEQPDFMSELVSTARIGRSLGVHLILATQKPTGVVDDQIWSNSRFKLALKVADESDSNEILKTPDAARITQPGRAYLQVGNNEIYELFQSAYSGAAFSEDIVRKGFDGRVYLLNNLGQGELLNDDLSEVDAQEESKLTQLDVVVNHVHDLYENMDVVSVEKPWLPPLEHHYVTPHICYDIDVGSIHIHQLSVPIAFADIPEAQMQEEYMHHFAEDGNFAVFGASGFGKSTTVMNLALTLASKNSPMLLNYFILDYGNSALAQLKALPHTADYLTFDDTDKLGKLMALMDAELKKRKALFAATGAINFKMYNDIAENALPAILVFIDNYDVVREADEKLEEMLVRLTRDGVGLGIYTVITASRTNVVRYSVLNNFKNKIALYMFDDADITAVTGRCAYKLPEVRGRAMVKMQEVHIAQCYLPVPFDNDIEYTQKIGRLIDAMNARNTASKAESIRIVPDVVAYDDLLPYVCAQKQRLVMGFNVETTEPAYLDLSITNQLIIGGPSTGKTNVLKIILNQLSGVTVFISDAPSGELSVFEDAPHVTYMEAVRQLDDFYDGLSAAVMNRQTQFEASELRIKEFCAQQPPIVVVIDDGDYFIQLCSSKLMDMENLVMKGIQLGVSFIVTTSPNKLRGFDNLTKIFKESQSGIVLGHPSDQNLLSITLPRAFKPMPDMGFWYKRGDHYPIKKPFIKNTNT